MNYSTDNDIIKFDHSFNNELDENIIKEISKYKHLTLGDDFNQPIDNLPNSITHLTFGSYFNQSVDNLPNSITNLKLGISFNQLVKKLPNSIQEIEIRGFLQKNLFPKKFDSIIFINYYNRNTFK